MNFDDGMKYIFVLFLKEVLLSMKRVEMTWPAQNTSWSKERVHENGKTSGCLECLNFDCYYYYL